MGALRRIFATAGLVGALEGGALAIETPRHEVILRRPDIEVRSYAPCVVAETDVDGSRDESGSEGFRRLAGYIFGGNDGGRRIDMTAPVVQGTRIDMTAPVLQRGAADRWTIRFVMPSRWTLDTLPAPRDPRVRLRTMPARTVAVLRYSGTWSEARYREHWTRLQQALSREGLEPVGEPEWARYDPPWKPWFLRTNEILVEVRQPGK